MLNLKHINRTFVIAILQLHSGSIITLSTE